MTQEEIDADTKATFAKMGPQKMAAHLERWAAACDGASLDAAMARRAAELIRDLEKIAVDEMRERLDR